MKKLMNFRPVLFIAAALSLSIYASYLFISQKIFFGVLVLSLIILVLLSFCLINKNKLLLIRNIIFAVVLLAISIAGFFTFRIITLNYQNATLNNSYYNVEGRVKDMFEDSSNVGLIIDSVSVDGIYCGKINCKMFVFVSGDISIEIGDMICFYGVVEDYSVFYDGRFNASNIVNKIKYSSMITSEDITINENNANVFEKVNVFIKNTLKSGLDKNEFAVAYAMLCGNSDYMDSGLLTNYRSAGVAHIFAVSGLHVGFLCSVLTFILKKSRINSFVKNIIIISTLIFYSGICGFSASSIRATIMCAVLLFANSFGKCYDMLSSIALASILILMITPHELMCPGFLLSFGVVLGIILLSPPIKRLLSFLPEKISSSLSVVFSAQLFSVPISLYFFGEFSAIAVIANLILIPFVSIIYVLCLICTFLAGISGFVKIFLFIPSIILKAVNYIISIIDYEIFMIGGFFFGFFVIAYYLIALILSDVINLKRIIKIFSVCILSVVLVVGTITINLVNINEVNAFVIGSQDFCATAITSKEEKTLIISYSKGAFSLSRLKSLGIKEFDKIFILNSGNGIDVHQICTRLISICNFNNVYYCCEKDEVLSAVLEKSFPNSNFYNSGDDNYTFLSNGYALNFSFENKNAIIFSAYNNAPFSLNDFSKTEVAFMVAYDYEHALNEYFKPNQMVTYLRSNYYINGQANGYYNYKFN